MRRLDLARVNRLDAGTEILGLIGRIRDAKPDNRGLHGAERHAEIRHDEIDIEKLNDNRDAADEIHQHPRRDIKHLDAGNPHHGPDQPEKGGEHQRADCHQHRQLHAL